MRKNRSVGDLIQSLSDLGIIIYTIIDSNFFLKKDKENLLSLLDKLSVCLNIKSCLSLIRTLIRFIRNYANLISSYELDLLDINLNILEKKIQKLINTDFGNVDEKYLVESIKSFAVGIIQELDDL